MGKYEAEEEIRGFLTISTCLYSLTDSEGTMEMFKAGVTWWDRKISLEIIIGSRRRLLKGSAHKKSLQSSRKEKVTA